MCGFIGVVSQTPFYTNQDIFSQHSKRLLKRGPDSSGFRSGYQERLLVQHYRLSVVDLSSFGNQPFENCNDSSSWISFNGEIYNHKELSIDLQLKGLKFLSCCDTEVLVNGLWSVGTEFLSRLSGQFAFAYISEKSDYLLLARDLLGEKPLYYIASDSKIVFGSDLLQVACFNRLPPKISKQRLAEYFVRGTFSNGNTPFEDVKLLRAGHYIEFDLRTLKSTAGETAYWKPRPVQLVSSIYGNIGLQKAALKPLLVDSITKTLSSDRKTSILLSGGIDSSIIAALASEVVGNIETYTVRFEHGIAGKDADIAAHLSQYLGSDHTEIFFGDLEPFILESIIPFLDTPITDPSILPSSLVYKAVSSKHTVVLTGDGADELFAGYNHYALVRKIEPYAKLLQQLPSLSLPFLSRLAPPSVRGRNWFRVFGSDISRANVPIRDLLFPNEIFRLTGFELSPAISALSCSSEYLLSALRVAMNSDLTEYLGELVLLKTDRASMMHSVEVRCPFLSRDIIDYSMNLPDHLLCNGNDRKLLLCKLADEIIPVPIRNMQTTKMGFSFSVDRLFRQQQWLSYLKDSISETNLPLNKKHIFNLVALHVSNKNYGSLLFSILMLVRWTKVHKISCHEH